MISNSNPINFYPFQTSSGIAIFIHFDDLRKDYNVDYEYVDFVSLFKPGLILLP